ncbi:mechanosensitive ion channel family protein [Gloeobacter kilaueensis]|uniref:Small conductance mechanosensitive channel n=1 Tax=Gloeobacter kilaueensis (strain ATCC BAA-2537 / CCAP 1431/1 / ULC 316 / JS1) TaxID=1183438 RepID=U5QNK3_GLOK1|nr:mechanosensitive ion channel family protein [Gloeobacter kilaueensis]AGY60567.1 small conductance mechanosensitive channel [Gloeobacter kilaueensis JS1]
MKLFQRVLYGWLIVAMLIGAGAPAARAQLSLPNLMQQKVTAAPDGVRRLGAIEVAPVRFEGRELFSVVSPTVRDRNNPGNLVPVEVRAELIEAQLKRVVSPKPLKITITTDDPPQPPLQLPRPQSASSTDFDPRSLRVYYSTLNGAIVIFATDDYHTKPLKILTITDQDADYYGLTPEELAQQWRTELDERLKRSLEERQPEQLLLQIEQAALATAVVAGISVGLWLLRGLVKLRDRVLAERQAQSGAEPMPQTEVAADGAGRQAILAAFRQQFTLQRRRGLLAIASWLLSSALVVTWIVGASFILALFPWTRELALQILSVPFLLVSIWFASGLINRIGDVLIDRFGNVWEENGFFSLDDAQRKSLRIATISRALKVTKTSLVIAVGITFALGLIGIPVASILAIGGILAFALTFGLQNIIKDVANGCLILWEDQYALGDVIAVGAATGLVENLNLRITQIRTSEGRLITIPNSAVVQVENLTRNWSRVDFTVEVAYESDIERALGLLKDVSQKMYDEPYWRERLIDLPEVLGVDALHHSGMLLRVWIKTRPLQQWPVGREFRLRVRLALEEQGIAIGTPQLTLAAQNEHSTREENRSHHPETDW